MYKQLIIVYTRADPDRIQYVRTYVSSYEPILDETLRRCSMRPEDVHEGEKSRPKILFFPHIHIYIIVLFFHP